MLQTHILIFAKSPQMGRAKTRLAKDIGPTRALRLNRLCHARTMRATRRPLWSRQLVIAPDGHVHKTHGGLWPPSIPRSPQGHGDLGQRLERAFLKAPQANLIVIGTDAPDISEKLLKQASDSLKRYDAVFGPADDGGFWLFGVSARLKRRHIRFNPVRWSSQYALEDLKSLLPPHTRIAYLPTLIDLDDADALKSWQAKR